MSGQQGGNRAELVNVNDRRIKVNVGGTVFEIAVSTLLDNSDYFRGQWDLSGGDLSDIFIDQDPTDFMVLLSFMRHGSIHVNNLTKPVLVLAEYLGLERLIRAVKLRMARNYGTTKEDGNSSEVEKAIQAFDQCHAVSFQDISSEELHNILCGDRASCPQNISSAELHYSLCDSPTTCPQPGECVTTYAQLTAEGHVMLTEAPVGSGLRGSEARPNLNDMKPRALFDPDCSSELDGEGIEDESSDEEHGGNFVEAELGIKVESTLVQPRISCCDGSDKGSFFLHISPWLERHGFHQLAPPSPSDQYQDKSSHVWEPIPLGNDDKAPFCTTCDNSLDVYLEEMAGLCRTFQFPDMTQGMEEWMAQNGFYNKTSAGELSSPSPPDLAPSTPASSGQKQVRFSDQLESSFEAMEPISYMDEVEDEDA